MNKVLLWWQNGNVFLARALMYVAASLLGLILGLVILQILLRNFFDTSIFWINEFVRISIVWIGFGSLPYTVLNNKLMTISDKPYQDRSRLYKFSHHGIMIFLCLTLFPHCLELIRMGVKIRSISLEFPMSIGYAVLGISFGLVISISSLSIVKHAQER